MTTPTTNQSSEDRRVKRALKYVSDYWMPINPKMLHKIRLGIEDGVYDSNTDLLVRDLRQDVSLFCHCLRRLATLLHPESEDDCLNLGSVFQSMHRDDLVDLFSVNASQISTHSMKGGSALQMSRFRETLLSATAAQALAEKCDLSPSLSYSAAVIRQLGLTLIAWNYPGTYEQAVAAMQSGNETLDMAIATRLGFSPATLASRLLSSWGMPDETTKTVGLIEFELDDDELDANGAGQSVSELCKLAEALSRANEPSVYPKAAGEWAEARATIEAMVGRDGLAEILERYQEVCEGYVTYVPELFQVGVLVPLEEESGDREGGEARSFNPYLAECSGEVKAALASFKERMQLEYDRRAVLRYFVDKTLPAFGFYSACVFTLDPGLMMLLPQLHVGRLMARALRPVDYSLALADGDVVAVAFRTNDPVIEYRQVPSGEVVTVMAGVLGRANRVGVFYIECAQVAMNEYQDQRVLHFLAARHVLHECLGLE